MNQQAMPSAPSLMTSPVLRFEDIDAVYFHAQFVVLLGQERDVGLAEDDEEVAFAGVLEVVRHVEVGVHAGLEHRDAAELVEFGGVRLVVEGAGDEDIEVGIAGFARGGDEIGARDGAELGADEDGGALLGLAFEVAAFGADSSPGQGVSAVKVILSSLCACCTPAVLRFSRIIWGKVCFSPYSAAASATLGSINSSFSSTPSTRCGLRLSTVKGPATRTFFLSS